MVRLEELKIVDSFHEWEAKGSQSEERNAGLSELESLRSLTSLEIDISDYNLFVEQICLSKQLVRYHINYVGGDSYYESGEYSYDRSIRLYLPGEVTVGNWILHLVRSTQSLQSKGDGSNKLIVAEIESLRSLIIRYCSTMKKLVNGMNCKLPVLVHLKLIRLTELEEIVDGTIPEGSNSFQRLESLHVEKLPKLAHLWKNQNQNVWLGNLKSIYIKRCPNLRYLFSVATARSLVQLQRVEINECDKMEQVFWNEMENNTDDSIMEFPKLEELILSNLPNLVAISQGVEIIESLHQLTKVDIYNCPKFRTKIGKCPNLRSIRFYKVHAPNHLLHCSHPRIQSLDIGDCESIEEILMWDEIKDEGERHIIFPELEELALYNLPCLTTFCRGTIEGIKFPKLKTMLVGNLPRLKSVLPLDLEATHDNHSLHLFCNPKVETPGLREICLCNLQDTINKIWCRHIPFNFFHNLERLHIEDVHGINNLISFSIAENLVNLKYLKLKGCQEMVHVIEDEKEVYATPLFRNLEKIVVERSHKLIGFCQSKHALELPSLKEVEITDCPEMETFTLGSLSTPDLSDFIIDNKKIKTKDLNGGIRDQFRIKNENKEKHEYSFL